MMMTDDNKGRLELYIIDTLQNDYEGLDQILDLLNDSEIGWTKDWGRPFVREEVRVVLLEMAKEGLINVYQEVPSERRMKRITPAALVECSHLTGIWFDVSDSGQRMWTDWDCKR